MPDPPAGMRVGRFGPFEVNLTTGELRKHGIRLKIQDQPFQILTLLLSCPEKLVTRDEIRQQLWPSGTFVDFDNGLNTALSRLREALGDSAESPRYVETLARRGYRWMVPVEWMDSSRTNLPAVASIGGPVVARETSENSRFSPLRQLALIQTLFFIPAVLVLLDLGRIMTESPGSLVLMQPWMKLEFGSEAAVDVAGLVFTGLSSLELWRGHLEAVRLFSRLFVLFLLFDALFIADISVRFLFYYIPKYALTLLPILVLVPFYQRRLALRILAAGSTESIRDGAKSR